MVGLDQITLGKEDKKGGTMYLKAYPVKSYDDIAKVKEDLTHGSIAVSYTHLTLPTKA